MVVDRHSPSEPAVGIMLLAEAGQQSCAVRLRRIGSVEPERQQYLRIGGWVPGVAGVAMDRLDLGVEGREIEPSERLPDGTDRVVERDGRAGWSSGMVERDGRAGWSSRGSLGSTRVGRGLAERAVPPKDGSAAAAWAPSALAAQTRSRQPLDPSSAVSPILSPSQANGKGEDS